MTNYIKSKVLIAATIVIAAIGGCTKADRNDDVVKGDPPPVPGGFTNSSQVAASSLLAYWSFDANNNESKSNAVPTKVVNVTPAKGIKGQGLKFSEGYMLYPTIAALNTANAVNSVTVSVWVNFANNGNKLTGFFTLARDTAVETSWLSIVNVAAETGRSATDNNLAFHSWIGSFSTGSRRGGDNINDFGNAGVDFQRAPLANKWVQYIMRYDAATNIIDLFANNIRVSNNNFRVRGGLGALVSTIPTFVLLGGLPNNSTGFSKSPTEGFHGLYNGLMDELRVYNKSLTDAEINALFILERQGR